jgi:hypothetical protein
VVLGADFGKGLGRQSGGGAGNYSRETPQRKADRYHDYHSLSDERMVSSGQPPLGPDTDHDAKKQDCHVPEYVDSALAIVAANHRNLVSITPKFEAVSCAAKIDGIHLHEQNGPAAAPIAAYYKVIRRPGAVGGYLSALSGCDGPLRPAKRLGLSSQESERQAPLRENLFLG